MASLHTSVETVTVANRRSAVARFFDGFLGRPQSAQRELFDPLETIVWPISNAERLTIRDCLSHTICLGSSGSGKTSSLMGHMMRGMFRTHAGGLVLTANPDDVKLIEAAAHDAGRQDQLVVVGPGSPWVLNPIQSELTNTNRGGGKISRVVELLLNGMDLFGADAANKNKGDRFWIEKSREFLTHLIHLDALARGGVSLSMLVRYLQDAYRSREDVIDEQVQKGNVVEKALERAYNRVKAGQTNFTPEDLEKTGRFFLKEFPVMADRTRESIVATITGILHPLLEDPIRTYFREPPNVHARDCWENNMIVVIDYPVAQFGEAGKLLQGLILFAFMKAVEGREFSPSDPIVFVIADEVHQFFTPYATHFQSYARGKGCSTLAASQSIAAFNDRLGGGPAARDATNAFLANFQNHFWLALDQESAEWASKQVGQVWDYTHNVGSSKTDGGGNLYSGVSEQLKAKILPHDLTNLKRGGPPHFFAEAVAYKHGGQWSNGSNFLRLQIPQIRRKP